MDVFPRTQFTTPIVHEQVGNDEVARWVQATFNRFRSYRKHYERNWYLFLDYYNGLQWPGGVGASTYWKSRLVVNYIRAIVDSIVAVAMDSDPKISVAAADPFQQDYASGLESCIDSIWTRGDVSAELRDAMTNACIYGTAYMFVYWDPKADDGLGNVTIKQIPTECVYPMPGARRVSECDQVFILRRESRAWLRTYFPDKADLCKASSSSADDYTRRRRVSAFEGYNAQPWLEGPLASGYTAFGGDDPTVIDKTWFSNPPYKTAYGTEERFDVIEGWIKDDSEEEKEYFVPEIVTDMFGMKRVVRKRHTRVEKKYPNGIRHIFVCGQVTLVDEPSPFPCIPIVKLVDQSTPDEWFGRGEPDILRSLQEETNKRRAQAMDHSTLNGGAVWLVNKDAGIQQDDLVNKPGQIIRYRPINGNEIRREPGVPMPSYFIQLMELAIRDMREISGVPAQAGGAPPRGVRSGAGFEASQSVATQRIRLRTRNLEQAIRDLGRIVIKFIQTFYTTPRWVRTVGTMGFTGHIPFDGRHCRGDWDLTVASGSTMNLTQQAREQQAIELKKLNAIDNEALLQALNFHGRAEVLRRMGMKQSQPEPPYDGWPGQPQPGTTDGSSYSLSVRREMGQAESLPTAPPPAGTVPQQGPQVSPIAGNPGWHVERNPKPHLAR